MDTNETQVYLAILIAAAVTGVVLVYFIIQVIRQHRKTAALNKKRIEVEIGALEDERKRIAADLHDELGPLLSSVRLQIGCVNLSTEQDQQVMQRASKYIDTILSRIRHISTDLMPQVLLRKGLVRAVEEFTDNLNQTGAIRIGFRHHGLPELPVESAIHLYRIIQEFIHNTLKHAGANELDLELYGAGKKLILDMKDNGKGMGETEPGKGSGLGLINMARRVEILQGDLYPEGIPGKGTRFRIEIPVL